MNEPSPIRGRWTLTANHRRGLEGAPMVIHGPRLDLYTQVEVVPVPDEQAIERAARALADEMECDFEKEHFYRPGYLPRLARAVLAAALEQPE